MASTKISLLLIILAKNITIAMFIVFAHLLQMASLTFLLTQQRCTLMTCSLQALIAGQNSLKHMFDIWSPDPFCQRLLFVNGCKNARKNKQPWFFQRLRFEKPPCSQEAL